MKTKTTKWFAFAGLAIVLLTAAVKTYASDCIECTNYPNNYHCYNDNCNQNNTDGGACCGNTL